MSLRLITPPATEPITLLEARSHLHVDETADDALIATLIAAARNMVEVQTGTALLSQQWRYAGAAFPTRNGTIEVGKFPLLSVQSINYVATTGATQLLAANQYVVDTDHALGRISPANGVTWPATQAQSNAVQVAFTAGYATPGAIPPTLLAALMLILGDLYANREGAIVGTSVAINPTVEALLDPWRRPVF